MDLPEGYIVLPHTGEALNLEQSSLAGLADARDQIGQLEQQLREVKQVIDAEVTARMDLTRLWTLHDGSWTLHAPSDALVPVWDKEALRKELLVLFAEGQITVEAADRAVSIVESLKLNVAGVKALLKNPQLAERLEQHVRLVAPENRRVTVKRAA
jgi:hypothetical protein